MGSGQGLECWAELGKACPLQQWGPQAMALLWG